MKKLIKISADLLIESKYDVNQDVINDILKGIDCWMDVHKINGKLYSSTLENPKCSNTSKHSSVSGKFRTK